MEKKSLLNKIKSESAVVGVVGLGYIGLSITEAIGKKKFPLVGFDSNLKKINQLKKGENYLVPPVEGIGELIKSKQFKPSGDPSPLKSADIIIISVPTSLDSHNHPDFSSLEKAFDTVSNILKKGQLIVLQSSTFPGTTDKVLLPKLEQKSGLKAGKDFFLAYVPEISNPGDTNYNFCSIPRIVSGITDSCKEAAMAFYKKFGMQVSGCPSTKVAEAAKILQNTYRLVNISLINELKILLDRMDIDIWEVIKAASTKPFGFCPFFPGPGAGGDCIPVDPEYLAWSAALTDGPCTIIHQAEQVNEMIPYYIVEKTVEGLSSKNKAIKDANILVLGVAFKKDMNDIRQSGSIKILSILKKKQANVHYHDPYVSEINNLNKFPDLDMKSIPWDYKALKNYDAIVIGTDHSFYDWNKIVKESRLIIDTRNATSNVISGKNKIIKA